MENEIQLISDGDGLAVIGHPAAVERFLTAERLPSKDLGLKRLGSALGTGSKSSRPAPRRPSIPAAGCS
ncbi:hypothetical protein [Paractinoplanes atraurantiacus]|uniref:hypothetical protein n=1 Tax=Paractinoplanes atraurantiacus TaxID=1036182 RepID=UPI001178770B|nr:hypothetical protein [Actinoplanes atraurantiacus]